MSTDGHGLVIPTARPGWRVWLGAAVIGLLVYSRAGVGAGAIVALLSGIAAAAWQGVALLGYIAGAVTPGDDEDQGDD